MPTETQWPHAPTHHLGEHGSYIVTASTYLHAHHFRSRDRVSVLHRGLLKVAFDYNWQLEAWAVFSNHYHFVGISPTGDDNAESLSPMLRQLHARTAGWVNKLDGEPGRKVWFNFRETHLTFEKSHLARLAYVHCNAVKHGLVAVANQYPWCSAAWFERMAPASTVEAIYRFKTDAINVSDDFEPSEDW